MRWFKQGNRLAHYLSKQLFRLFCMKNHYFKKFITSVASSDMTLKLSHSRILPIVLTNICLSLDENFSKRSKAIFEKAKYIRKINFNAFSQHEKHFTFLLSKSLTLLLLLFVKYIFLRISVASASLPFYINRKYWKIR